MVLSPAIICIPSMSEYSGFNHSGCGIFGNGFTVRFSLLSISWIHTNWWSAGQILQCRVLKYTTGRITCTWSIYIYIIYLYNNTFLKQRKVVVIDRYIISFSNLDTMSFHTQIVNLGEYFTSLCVRWLFLHVNDEISSFAPWMAKSSAQKWILF